MAAYEAVGRREDVRLLYLSGGAIHEVPFTMEVEGTWCAAPSMPRARQSGDLTVLEFKTGRPRPEHRTQVELYRRAAQGMFPDTAWSAARVRGPDVASGFSRLRPRESLLDWPLRQERGRVSRALRAHGVTDSRMYAPSRAHDGIPSFPRTCSPHILPTRNSYTHFLHSAGCGGRARIPPMADGSTRHSAATPITWHARVRGVAGRPRGVCRCHLPR